jgi:hypothetical protein
VSLYMYPCALLSVSVKVVAMCCNLGLLRCVILVSYFHPLQMSTVLDFSLWFRSFPFNSAKFQLSTSCRSGLAFWTSTQKNIPVSILDPPMQNFQGFGYCALWFGWLLYKSAEFQLSTSSRSGFAFLEKHKT